MERVEKVRNLNIFEALNGVELEELLRVAEEKIYKAGDVIIEEAINGAGLFILDSGAAVVKKNVSGANTKVIGHLHPGDHFGEMSLVTHAPTTASVEAEEECVCIFIPKDKFLGLMDDKPAIGRKVLWNFVQTLSRRLKDADQRYARTIKAKDRFGALRHLLTVSWVEFRMAFAYLWLWLRKKMGIPYKPEQAKRIHRLHARRFKEMACKVKGANIKTGQLASMQAHILPIEFIEEFREMRDKVTATDYVQIAGLIQEEFGMGPLELFEDFDKIPLAAASMGQVHRAKLHTGEDVVVKVLHPGLERSVIIDLWVVRNILRVINWFMDKRFDLMQLYREAEAPLLKELDLLHEGQATDEMANELAILGVKVPKVYWRYSTRRVLTLEYLPGTNLDNLPQLKEWGVDRKKLMQSYLKAFFHQAFGGGFFHCDPHPGNAFCLPDGKLALLDFGMVKRLPEHMRDGIMKEFLGSFFNNPRLYVDGLIQKGAMGEADRALVEKKATEMLADPKVRKAAFDHDIKVDGDLQDIAGELLDVLKQMTTFKMPQDNLMFLRAVGIAIDVCKEIVPETPVSEIAMPVLGQIFADYVKKNPHYAIIPPATAAAQPAR